MKRLTEAITEKGRIYEKLRDRKQTELVKRIGWEKKQVKTKHLSWETKVFPVFGVCLDSPLC